MLKRSRKKKKDLSDALSSSSELRITLKIHDDEVERYVYVVDGPQVDPLSYNRHIELAALIKAEIAKFMHNIEPLIEEDQDDKG